MLAVANDHIFDSLVARVDECSADVFGRGYFGAVLAKLEHIAVLKHHDVIRFNDSKSPSPIPVSVELAMFAMNRHKESRSDSFDQYLQILLAPVTRYVNSRNAAVDDSGPALVAVGNQSRDRRL